MPGNRVLPVARTDNPMSRPVINIGQHGGPMDDFAQFNTEGGRSFGSRPEFPYRKYGSPAPTGPRVTPPGLMIDTSHVTGRSGVSMDDVMRARRARGMDLGGPSDPGLSTRGRVGAPGRGARPVTGGIEGRGTTASGRRKPMPGPRGGTGRGLEGRGVRPEPGSRMLPRPAAPKPRGVRPFPTPGHGGRMGIPAPISSGMNAPVVPAMAPNPSLIGQLGQLQGGYAGVVGDSVRAVQAETRTAQRPMRQRALNNARAQAGARLGGSQNRPVAGGVGPTAGPGPTTPGPRRTGPVDGALDAGRKLPKRGRGLLIGAGAAVVAGLAYSGRRGEGSSGGRTSMSRY